MGRGKLKLELIADEKARKSTYQKRKKGIMKKAYEFSVLCDVDVCLLVSGPVLNDGVRSDHLDTWPPERHAALEIVKRFRAAAARAPPQKSYTLSDVLGQKKRKAEAQLAKAQLAQESGLDGLSAEELGALVARLDDKIAAVRLAIEEANYKASAPLLGDFPSSSNVDFMQYYYGAPPHVWGPAFGDAPVPEAMTWNPPPPLPPVYFYPDPPPLPVGFDDPGIAEISPVILAACEGNGELWSVVNDFTTNKRRKRD